MPPDRDSADRHEETAPLLPLAAAPIPAWAVTLVRLLDDALLIPGTRIGIGLDAILGFIFPGVGDAAMGLASLALLIVGLQLRVPKIVLARMVFNILLDSLIGAIPILGDAFDLFWRSNRKNLDLLRRYDRNPERAATAADYIVVGLGVLLVLAAVALPIALGFALLRWFWHALAR